MVATLDGNEFHTAQIVFYDPTWSQRVALALADASSRRLPVRLGSAIFVLLFNWAYRRAERVAAAAEYRVVKGESLAITGAHRYNVVTVRVQEI